MSTATLTSQPTAAPTAAAASSLPFGRLLRVEWRKSTDTRAARWLLGSAGLLAVAIMVIPLIWTGTFEQTWSSYLLFAAYPLAVILPVVSILTMTSEWTQRSVLVTFTQEPRRGRVFGAKVTVGLALAAVGAAVGLAVSAAALVLSDLLGRSADFDGTWKLAAGFTVFLLLNSAMGMAFASVLHNSAAAIVLFFVLPTVWTLISVGVFEDIGKWLDTGQTFPLVLMGDWAGNVAEILTSTGAWVLLPLAAGLIRTVRREVK